MASPFNAEHLLTVVLAVACVWTMPLKRADTELTVELDHSNTVVFSNDINSVSVHELISARNAFCWTLTGLCIL